MSGAWAIVPVKCFARGKSRLSALLPRDAREELARSLCEHVLGVLGACTELAGILVATDCALVERFAETRGAEVLRDASSGPLSAVVDRALAVLAGRGARAALVVMGDLPRLAADDVRSLVAALAGAQIVLAPDRHGEGTNALALSPPDRLLTCFGSYGSFERHVARAAEQGAEPAIHRSDGTGYDLDSPEDLALASAYAEGGARLSWKRNRPSRVRAA